MANKTRNKQKSYKKPPITEAVIELRFKNLLSDKQLETLIQRKRKEFSIQKLELVEFQINLKTGAPKEPVRQFIGYKLTRKTDSSYIVQVKHNSISLSRLPPYESWPKLLDEFKKYYNWFTGKKFKALARIGVRYINRLDIPVGNGKLDLDEYFNFSVKAPPKNFPSLNNFIVQAQAKIDDDKAILIQLRSIESPLLKHSSFIFDLDVDQQDNLPNSDSELDEILDDMRLRKNHFFEQLLTAKCKRLFN